MKSFRFIMFRNGLIVFTALMFFQGCSSSNKLSNYKEPGKFYERLNDRTEGKKVEITTNAGVVVTAPNGVQVINDSVYILAGKRPHTTSVVPLKLISNIAYTNDDPDNLSAFIYMNSGDSIEAYNIKKTARAVKFESPADGLGQNSFSLSEINRVKVKSRLMALPAGIIIGALGGMIVSAFVHVSARYYPDTFSSYSGKNTSSNLTGGAIIGGFLGAIISQVVGFNYNFYFY